MVVTLFGVVGVSLYGTLDSVRRKENAHRVASLLRSASAQACHAGRRYRVAFDPETYEPRVTWEPRPLEEPGTFVEAVHWWVERARLEPGIRVARCELTGPSDFAEVSTDTPAAAGAENGLATITFYPDGTSDSARILLTDEDEEQPWHAEVTLNGVDGSVDTRRPDAEEVEEMLE